MMENMPACISRVAGAESLKRYAALLAASIVSLGVINNLISSFTYAQYGETGGAAHSLLFYVGMNFALAAFFSIFLVALYVILRDGLPGKRYVKGLFFGVCIVWLLGPVFPLSYELAFTGTVQAFTLMFTATSLASWILFGLALEFLYAKIYGAPKMEGN